MSYSVSDKFLIAVDCVIFGFDGDALNLLLCRREIEPEKGQWSLMGGFLSPNETLDEAAYRVLARITGLRDIYMEQLYTFSAIERDPEDRVISTVYFSLINSKDCKEYVSTENGVEWHSISGLPKLIFDHNEMVVCALKKLKAKVATQPIGFELLPENFTITQLRKLYSAIYQRDIDPANFRRKLLAMGVLEQLPIKEKSSSKKGSFLYAFNKQKYEVLQANGFSFDLIGS